MSAKTIEVNQDNWETEVLKASLPVLVSFWAEHSSPSKMLDPLVTEIAEEYQGKLTVAKFNAGTDTSMLSRYAVMGLPALILFKEGKDIERLTGFRPKDKIIEKFGKHFSA